MKREAIRPGLAVLLLAAAVLPGCDGSEPVGTVRSELAQEVVDMGFRPDMIVEFENHFLVEGDIKILKADLQKRMAGAQRTAGRPGDPARYQWVSNNLVGASKVSNINVYIDPSVPNDWGSATRAAINHWSNVTGTAVRFVEMTPANIVVSMAQVQDNPIAEALFPTSGADPGGTVTIDSDYSTWGNSSQKVFVMVHELGHTIGFRHTNWQARGECVDCGINLGANQVSGTPQTDGSSVMNGGTGGTSWSSFSSNDLLAMRTVYPSPAAPTLTSIGTNPSPPRQYLSFTTTATGSGFNPASAEIVFKGSSMSSCPTECVIPGTNYSTRTSTQVVGNVAYSIAGTYSVYVRNGPKGYLSSPQQITIQPF